MAHANVARWDGDDYQARLFWRWACELLRQDSPVVRVSYELDAVKAFDDLVVEYRDGYRGDDGNPLAADYYQSKFHVAANGAITFDALMDPAFINATATSLLQRLRDAVQDFGVDGRQRFILFTPWSIHPDSLLAKVFLHQDGSIAWARLQPGGEKSEKGQVRAKMREHLELDTDEELRVILAALRIHPGPTLEELRRQVEREMAAVGLRPPPSGVSFPPDDLPRKLVQAGRITLTRESFLDVCRQAGLLGPALAERPAERQRIGFRSYRRHTEGMELEFASLLCLIRHFDGRHIRDPEHWQHAVLTELAKFLGQLRPGARLELHLRMHPALAFAIGYQLESTAGIEAIPAQYSKRGVEVWGIDHAADPQGYPRPLWLWEWVDLGESRQGADVALVLSVATDATEDARDYIERCLPRVRRALLCRVAPIPGSTIVRDGTHAHLLAQDVAHLISAGRTVAERRHPLHLFAAAPVAFLFFLGQEARSRLRNCVFYEHDPDARDGEVYTPALGFPPAAPSPSRSAQDA